MVEEFEDFTLELCRDDLNHCHHEQHLGVQAAFMKDVRSLTAVFEEMRNPFLEESQDLMVLDTRDIMNTSVVETMRKAEMLGEKQYNMFLGERLPNSMKPIKESLPKNKLALFSCTLVKRLASKQKLLVTALKNDCSLFSPIYVSCEIRDGDLDNFLTHENQVALTTIVTGRKASTGYQGRHPSLH